MGNTPPRRPKPRNDRGDVDGGRPGAAWNYPSFFAPAGGPASLISGRMRRGPRGRRAAAAILRNGEIARAGQPLLQRKAGEQMTRHRQRDELEEDGRENLETGVAEAEIDPEAHEENAQPQRQA